MQVPVLADMENGKDSSEKVMLWANRNGFYYVLDRTSGQFLTGKPFSTVTWAKGLDEAGRPMRVSGIEPTTEGQRVYPGVQGATNWYSPSFSPRTGLFYIPAWDKYSSVFVKVPTEYIRKADAMLDPRRGLYLGIQGTTVPISEKRTKATARSAQSIPRPASKSGNLRCWMSPMPAS